MSILDRSADSGHSALDPITAKIKNPFNTTVPNGGARPDDFPDGFEIWEYVDGKLGPPLQLLGNMLPMQPFPWSTEQHMTKEYYPGNPEAAVHVMGTRYGPLAIHGRFKDKRYKDPAYYGAAYTYARALDEIVKRGNLLKFGLQGPGGKWIRWGFLEKSEFKMNKLSWVDYTLNFFVVSETQPINDFFSDPEKQVPDGINFNLINAAAAFKASNSAVPTSMPLSIAGLINNFTNSIAKNVNLVTGFVQNIIDTGQDISAAAHRALGLIQNARNTISSQLRQIDSVTHSFANLSLSGKTPAQTASDTYKNLNFIHGAVSSAHPISLYLKNMQSQFESIAKSIPIGRYRVKKNDTLQNISVKYYGNPGNWSNIYDHNKLQSTQLTEGAALEIPHL